MPKPPEKALRKLVGEWVEKAATDLRLAEYLLSENTPFLDAAAFHCQQAAEKYLKAFLVRNQVDFPKTHDIEKLLELTGDVDKRLAKSLLAAADLTPHGVRIRYPDDSQKVDRKKAEAALLLAQKVEKTIQRKIDG